MKQKDLYQESTTTFIICLISGIISGYILWGIFNLNNYINNLKSKFEIVVFINKNEKAPEICQEKINNIPNIETVKFISKNEIKNKMDKLVKELGITETENPFPDTFSIKPKLFNKNIINDITNELKKINSIEEVRYDMNLVNIVSGLIIIYNTTCYIIIFTISLLLVLVVLVTIFNFSVINKNLFKNKIVYINLISGIIAFVISNIIFVLTKKYIINDIEQIKNMDLKYIFISGVIIISIIFIRTLFAYSRYEK